MHKTVDIRVDTTGYHHVRDSMRGRFAVQIDVRGWPGDLRGSRESDSAENHGKTVPTGVGFCRKSMENCAEQLKPDWLRVPNLGPER